MSAGIEQVLRDAEDRYLAALDAHRHVEGLRITGSRAEREHHAAGGGLTCEQVAEAGASICAVIDAGDEVRRAFDWERACRIAYLRSLS